MSETITQNKAQYYRDLIKRIQVGEESAEHQLVEELSPKVQRFILSKTRSDNIDWQDIYQDVFLAALLNFRKKDFELKSDVRSYVFRIAQNKIFEHIKKKIEERTHTEPLDKETKKMIMIIAAERDLEREETIRFLLECLENLKQQHKDVLRLKYYEEAKGSTIRKKLKLSSETKVHDLTFYAKKKLRECVEEKMD